MSRCVVQVCLSEAEKASWWSAAARAGVSLSVWVRRSCSEAVALEEAEAALEPDRVAA